MRKNCHGYCGLSVYGPKNYSTDFDENCWDRS